MIEIVPLLTSEVIERFWAKVLVINDEDSCWEWTAVRNIWGYGRQTIEKKPVGAHRLSWVLANNREIPEGLSVLHRCDNPACVRPSHLFVGTQKENMEDKARKGRCGNPWGEKNKQKMLDATQSSKTVKLNKQLVLEIRSKHSTGMYKQTELAAEYQVSQPTIDDILKRRTWKNI